MNARDPRLDLIERYVDGRATAEDVARLEQELRTDAALRAVFLEYANVDSTLEACCAHVEAPVSSRQPSPWRIGWSAWLNAWRPLAATVAVILVGIGLIGLWPASPKLRPAVPVTFEVLESDALPVYAKGQQFTLSTLRIEGGSLHLRLASGAELQAVGPAELDFLSPMEVRLRSGAVTADVGKDARGFVIQTPEARIVDVGTRFGVSLNEPGATRVAVFEGRVYLFEPGKPEQVLPGLATLKRGEAVQVDSRNRLSRLTTASLALDGLSWSASAKQSIIAELTDNVEDPDFHWFYGLIPGGLTEGAPAYTDRARMSWYALAGQTFPKELVGADLVCPFHTDRHQRDLRIRLRLSAPAVVYVMHDVRRPAQDWLKGGFVETGMRLRSGPWAKSPVVRDLPDDGAGDYYIEYAVWRKEVPQAGVVELGPPHVPGAGGAKAMMGIAVKPLAPAHP